MSRMAQVTAELSLAKCVAIIAEAIDDRCCKKWDGCQNVIQYHDQEIDLHRLIFPKWIFTTFQWHFSGQQSAFIKLPMAFSHQVSCGISTSVASSTASPPVWPISTDVWANWDVKGCSWPSACHFFIFLSNTFCAAFYFSSSKYDGSAIWTAFSLNV